MCQSVPYSLSRVDRGFITISSVCPTPGGHLLVQENYQVTLPQHLRSKECELPLSEMESLRARQPESH